MPFAQSSMERPSRVGSKLTATLSSWCRKTGGISLKDEGVDADTTLYSSTEMNFGRDVMSDTAGMVVDGR